MAASTAVLVVALMVWLPGTQPEDQYARSYLWNSGTDLNGPYERVLIEIPLQGKRVSTFQVTITYAYGGPGWVAFMNRGGTTVDLVDTGGAIRTASFVADPEFINRNGTQNVSIRGQNTSQGLHLYSIEVSPINGK
jgi:hypothetical protein